MPRDSCRWVKSFKRRILRYAAEGTWEVQSRLPSISHHCLLKIRSHLCAAKLNILNYCPSVLFLYQPVKWSSDVYVNVFHTAPRGQHSSAAGWLESALQLRQIGLNWWSLQLKTILLPGNGSGQTKDTLAFSLVRQSKNSTCFKKLVLKFSQSVQQKQTSDFAIKILRTCIWLSMNLCTELEEVGQIKRRSGADQVKSSCANARRAVVYFCWNSCLGIFEAGAALRHADQVRWHVDRVQMGENRTAGGQH